MCKGLEAGTHLAGSRNNYVIVNEEHGNDTREVVKGRGAWGGRADLVLSVLAFRASGPPTCFWNWGWDTGGTEVVLFELQKLTITIHSFSVPFSLSTFFKSWVAVFEP